MPCSLSCPSVAWKQLDNMYHVIPWVAGRQLTGSFPIPLGDIEVPLKGVGSVVMAAKGKKDQQVKQSVELTPVSSSDATQILDSTFGLLQKALV